MKIKYVVALSASLHLACGSAVAVELIPPGKEKPVVFAAKAGAFAGKSEVKNIYLPVSGAKILKNVADGGELELVIKARAADVYTTAAEITLHCEGGKTLRL